MISTSRLRRDLRYATTSLGLRSDKCGDLTPILFPKREGVPESTARPASGGVYAVVRYDNPTYSTEGDLTYTVGEADPGV